MTAPALCLRRRPPDRDAVPTTAGSREPGQIERTRTARRTRCRCCGVICGAAPFSKRRHAFAIPGEVIGGPGARGREVVFPVVAGAAVADEGFEAAVPPQSVGAQRRTRLRQPQRIEIARQAIVERELIVRWGARSCTDSSCTRSCAAPGSRDRVRQQEVSAEGGVQVHAGAQAYAGSRRSSGDFGLIARGTAGTPASCCAFDGS